MDVLRATHACLRCRRQKKKCDRGVPKCSHCRRANAVCTRETSIGGSQVAFRSVSELEAEISQLKAKVAAVVSTGPEQLDPIPAIQNQAEGETRGTNDRLAEQGPTIEINSQPQTPGLDVLADLNNATVYDYENYGLKRMLGRALMIGNDTSGTDPNKQLRKPLLLLSSPFSGQSLLRELPNDLCSLYLGSYFEHVNPTFPILMPERIDETLKRIKNGESVDPNESCLMYLALALGAVFPSTDNLVDSSNACQLWLAAVKLEDLEEELENTVRRMILLTLFSIFEEGCGSSWHLVELVVRSCIKLGLHSEAIDSTSSKEHTSLFWSAYLLDRWVSCALGLPVSICNEEITLRIPELFADSRDRQVSANQLWHMAYNLGKHGSDRSSTMPPVQLVAERESPKSTSFRTSKFLHDTIERDLGIADAAHCIIREGGSAALGYEKLALDQLSAVEAAARRGLTLPWTTGFTTFVSVMIRLISFGHVSRRSLLFAQNVPQSTLITNALDVMRSLGRKFRFLDWIGDTLEQIQNSDEARIRAPRHSQVFTIASCGLQAIGMSLE